MAIRSMSNRRRLFGRHIVQDPSVCHGAMTFRGTRILVDDILEQVAEGVSWEAISEQWGGKVTGPMIAEAVRLAHESLRTKKIDPAA